MMGKKLTVEFVREQFEKGGYKLVSKEYKNTKRRLEYICPEGHRGSICWDSFKRGYRCPICNRAKRTEETIEQIRAKFKKEGYTLLTKKYKNCFQKLEYICPRGHKDSIKWSGFQQGVRCAECLGVKKKTIEFIRSEFEKEEYKLLTIEYEGCNQKLKCICPKGHSSEITWHSFQQGCRCAKCYNEKNKKTIEQIRSEFEKEGYQLLTKEYKNAYQKLEYICDRGHRRTIGWGCFQQGARCPVCNEAKRIEEIYKKVKVAFKKRGYTLISRKYISSTHKLKYICPQGHLGRIRWSNFQRGDGCRICYEISISGKGHPNWKGGIACEPYCSVWLDEEYKDSVMERDNYQCQNEDCWGTSNKLYLHHINYNKKDCSPSNLITVCNSCNARANFNREYWQKYYETRIQSKE